MTEMIETEHQLTEFAMEVAIFHRAIDIEYWSSYSTD
jgi:hypothetical protein